MLRVLTCIAEQVDRQWSQAGYDPGRFPELAAQALIDHEPPDLTELARALSGGMTLSRQRRMDQSFGQPALTLYHDERFVVEALCWHTGSPAIHHHSFSGAFRVMTGRSVHGRYRFAEQERVAGSIGIGQLELVESQVLDRTSVTRIPAGPGLIHSAFHLDNPSMTVIVRTHDNGEPEHTYLPPGVAYDPAARTESLHKRLQLLDTLHGAGHPSYEECVRLALDAAGVHDGMEVLLRVHNHGQQPRLLDELTARYVRRHGSRVEPVVAAVREQQRRSRLLGLRATVHEPDVRYALACLLNAFDRGSFCRQLSDGDLSSEASDVLSRCLRHVLGMSAEAEPVLRLACDALLGDLPPSEFPSWVASQVDEPIGAEQTRLLAELYQHLLTSPLLTPLRQRGATV